ncbi:hypothetical protein EYF80_039269 [Liparis tanakae]|uniref:Uncharacterized protein n=1 Tax=Liparis tanakae TaxID=230148 RepID=A0A4Z2GBB2_9TELE|nr:hypothetical protein EYF80_039269 [Liparis tanakae]
MDASVSSDRVVPTTPRKINFTSLCRRPATVRATFVTNIRERNTPSLSQHQRNEKFLIASPQLAFQHLFSRDGRHGDEGQRANRNTNRRLRPSAIIHKQPDAADVPPNSFIADILLLNEFSQRVGEVYGQQACATTRD